MTKGGINISASYPDLNLTVFPDGGVDTFITYLNIVATDGPLIHDYMTAMENGNQVAANQILAQIPSATQKLITAQGLNKLTQAILAVERFYLRDIKPYIEEKQEELAQSSVQFDYKGNWSAGTSYLENNMVSYVVNGASLIFLAIKDAPAGVPPTSAAYWRALTIQGPQGPAGEGVTFRQEWNNTTAYTPEQIVSYNNALWQSLTNNTNSVPSSSSLDWKLIMQMSAIVYPIQAEQPLDQEEGDLWFNTDTTGTNYYYLEPLSNIAGASQILSGYSAYGAEGTVINGTGSITTDISAELAALWELTY